MEIIDLKKHDNYLTEYITLCNLEWGSKEPTPDYINNKKEQIFNEDKVISILGLIDNNILIGFISLFKYDGELRKDLTPWYATMYIKKEYRNKGYSKLLNEAILKEANKLGYNKVYLKTELKNYYEKFGAQFIEQLDDKEKLYSLEVQHE